MYPWTGADSTLLPHPLIWLVAAPHISRTSASHWMRLRWRLRAIQNKNPVVMIFRFPKIWYVAASTYIIV